MRFDDARTMIAVRGSMLPITDVEVFDNPGDIGMEIRFRIGTSIFRCPIFSAEIHGAAGRKDELERVVTAPLYELRCILKEAEQRGRDKERESILGEIAARTSVLELWLGYARRLIGRWRRMRRAARRNIRKVATSG